MIFLGFLPLVCLTKYGAASHFHNAFPAMFSPSQKCRAPHLNLDNLRDALFASDVVSISFVCLFVCLIVVEEVSSQTF